ncbi:hypothetical protein Q670_04200 [Alcanivorax sp. P2S70]|uniref:Imm39 family immunity protein n=1 Tax=Alcanivorax sp. P2S70 TaxID=1397527 RepID=UPI0003B7AB1F|nr:Imm39 family immunity protein [Alcanivorax sp. P2S70]ERP89603.1 hypothetical protein Q670_04200 [Alcanivorax sp. P2S70]
MSDKLITIGGIGQAKGRVKGMGPVDLAIRDELDGKMRKPNWLASAPFEGVSIILRYAEASRDKVLFEKINKHKELPLAIDISMEDLKSTEGNPDQLKAIVWPAIDRCMCAVQSEYGPTRLST